MEGETKGETVTIKKSTMRMLTVVVVVLLIGISFTTGYTLGTGSVTGKAVAQNVVQDQQPNQQAQQQQPQQPQAVQVSADDDAVLGDPNAPVEIIEFSDFQCTYCGRFYTQTLPELKSKYIDTGKVKLVYRDFPLSFHPEAQSAAEAAECAKEQGKFWEFHDKIFENQGSMSAAAYKQWAAELGLNAEQFNSCYDSGKYKSEVQKDFQDGQKAGVSGTPTCYVNGHQIIGAQPFSAFQSIIEQELAS